MADIKNISEIADKWARVTPGRSRDYADGINNPRRSWATATAAAKDAWKQGIDEAAARGAFEDGVNDAGDSKWKRKASTLGVNRFGEGVRAAKGDYQSGFAPFVQVIQGVDLPPRGAKGDPRNYERSKLIGEALHEAKIRGV